VRVPVEYVCPHCGKLTDQAVALKAEAQARKSRGEKLDRKLQPIDCLRITCANHACGKPFASQWATDELKEELGLGRETSDKFDIGRNFCTKLWNAARFAFMNLEGTECHTLDIASLPPEDRWILARLSQTIRRYHDAIAKYQFSASVKILREFFWEALCDWYIELTKPRFTSPEPRASARAVLPKSDDAPPSTDASARAISPEPNDAPSPANASARADSPASNDTRAAASATAKQVLAFSLDQILRLFHPTIPHITERLWQTLGSVAPKRGLPGIADLNTDTHLVLAEFPPVEGYPAFDDESILDVFADLQAATRGVRELRSKCGVLPKDRVVVTIVAPEDHIESFKGEAHVVKHMAGIGTLSIVTRAARPANSASVTIGGLRIFVHDISDDQADRTRTKKALADVEKQVVGKEKKLSNEKFVTNAKPEVVAAERTRLEALVKERDALTAHLSELEA
ncbi:MAG: class I tRNA ligase family protein, partial [Planctomycetes bacterium]|nr:class I tRNA ligase family protein [Planctomycetota bacterium]